MKYGSISFEDLKNGNFEGFTEDVDSCVVLGPCVRHEDDLDQIEQAILEDLRDDAGFVTDKEARVAQLLRVTGNVRGDEGRWDHVIVFDRDPKYNVIGRLRTGFKISWICDFTVNYARDYGM